MSLVSFVQYKYTKRMLLYAAWKSFGILANPVNSVKIVTNLWIFPVNTIKR